MTTTILNIGNGEDVDITAIAVMDPSNWAIIDQSVSADGNTRESTYQLVVGNAEYPMSLRVGFYKNPTALGGIGTVNVSAKLITYAQKADVDSDILWTHPTAYTLAKSMPGMNAFPDADHDEEAIGHLLSVFFPVTAGVLDTGAIDELKFGVVSNVLTHENSSSA